MACILAMGLCGQVARKEFNFCSCMAHDNPNDLRCMGRFDTIGIYWGSLSHQGRGCYQSMVSG